MNKKLIRNIEKQKNLRKKKEEIEIELQTVMITGILLTILLEKIRKKKIEKDKNLKEKIQMKVRKIYEKNNQWNFSCDDATCKSSEYSVCKSCICKYR